MYKNVRMVSHNNLLKTLKFRKKDVPRLRYGIIHSQIGFHDGVSIVIKQLEKVMVEELGINKGNIYYLVGKAKSRGRNIHQRKVLWHRYRTNQLMLRYFEKGYSDELREEIEQAIGEAESAVREFVEKNKIDVLIVHNSSHPVNFISSIGISRYYKHNILEGKRTPKYILWWHDSHLERPRFRNPSDEARKYLLEGVPGRYVEYIIFINTLQFNIAQNYFLEIDKEQPGFYDSMLSNHDVIYNTTDVFINSYDELRRARLSKRVVRFLEDYDIRGLLKHRNLSLKQVLFCLQHTRIIPRKRIDFALRYCFELLRRLRSKTSYKAIIFFVSGHSRDESKWYKRSLKRLHKKLCEEYNTKNVVMVFAEDYKKADIKFEEIPQIIARLGGIATYFSEIEGFGNNLLEVLASGLIPVVYTYPVFVKDIARKGFKVIALKRFEVEEESLRRTMRIIRNEALRKKWVDKNLYVLKKHFQHRIMSRKLIRAIIRRRTHT